MADGGGSWAEAMAAYADIAMQAAGIAAQATGTAMKINEAISDYNYAIADINAQTTEANREANRRRSIVTSETTARLNEVSAEASRRRSQTTEEGVLALKEQGAQAEFESRMAMTQAEMTASGQEARLGSSGTRLGGSPLLAAQQDVNLAFAAADRTAESGAAQMKIGGVQLKNRLGDITADQRLTRAELSRQQSHELSDITAQESYLTADYGRKVAEMTRKRNYLSANKAGMVAIAAAGGLAGLSSSFYNYGRDLGWFDRKSGKR